MGKVISQLEEIQKSFLQNPAQFNQYVDQIEHVVLDFGCRLIEQMLEECNTLLENSGKRRKHWQIKDSGIKTLLTPMGTISFTRTRFTKKATKETAYLLDQLIGLTSRQRLSHNSQARILEEAAQSSYEKAAKAACPSDPVTRQTVMRLVRGLTFPEQQVREKPKRQVSCLHVEADEDHIPLQYRKKKGDIKRWKGHGNNGQIVKLVYVHEGKEEEGGRKRLSRVFYFGGIYQGEESAG